MTGVLGELGGSDESDQIDHALEIGRAWLGEVSTQMLSAQSDRGRQLLCRDWSTGVRNDDIPGAALERSVKAEGLRRLDERVTKASRKRVRIDEIARDVFVDAFRDDVDETEAGAPRDCRCIGRTKRQDGEERRTGKFSSKSGSFPNVLVR